MLSLILSKFFQSWHWYFQRYFQSCHWYFRSCELFTLYQPDHLPCKGAWYRKEGDRTTSCLRCSLWTQVYTKPTTIPILATIIDYHHFKNVQEASSEDHFQFSAAISDVHVDSNELITDDYDGIIILRSSFYHYVRLVMKFMTWSISKHGASFVFITMVCSVNLLKSLDSHLSRLLGS